MRSRKINSCFILLILINSLFVYLHLTNTISLKNQPINNHLFYALHEESTPKLDFSTFLGGSFEEYSYGIAVTTDGISYVTGSTRSANFPTLNAYNNSFGGGIDIFISKLSSDGKLLWSTFFGGNENDASLNITTDFKSNCYIIGATESTNFPTKNAFDNSFNNGLFDTFLFKFSQTEQVKKIALIILGTYSFVFFSIMILIILVKKRKKHF